jgi:hypothetical protein
MAVLGSDLVEGLFEVGAFTQFTSGSTTTTCCPLGTPWEVDSQVTGNLHVQYSGREFRPRLRRASGSARNTNEAPAPVVRDITETLYTAPMVILVCQRFQDRWMTVGQAAGAQ